MGILSLVIWTPIVLGVLIFALGRDEHAGLVRWAALFSALLSFFLCVPLYTDFDTSSASMQFVVGYSMKEFHYIASQMDKGHCDPKAIISNDIPLADLPKMMDVLRGSNNETKVHVCM